MKTLKLKKHDYPGKLITFCGLDGCGKTTNIKMIYNWLIECGYDVLLTKQPTSIMRNTEIFRNFMDCSNHEGYEYRSLSLMAAADRLQHCNQVIIPALKEGKIVLSDRYFYSCLANLRARGYKDDEWIYEIASFIPKPNLSIFLDVKVSTALNRVRERPDEKYKYIDIDLQFKLKDEYKSIAKNTHSMIYDSSTDIKGTYENIKKALTIVISKTDNPLELLHA